MFAKTDMGAYWHAVVEVRGWTILALCGRRLVDLRSTRKAETLPPDAQPCEACARRAQYGAPPRSAGAYWRGLVKERAQGRRSA